MNKRTAELNEITGRVVAAIAEIRVEKGLSMRKLATMAGVTQPGISYVEKGTKKPTLHFLLQICKALEVDLWPLVKTAEQSIKKRSK